MPPRDLRRLEPDAGGRLAPDDMLAVSEWKLATTADQPTPGIPSGRTFPAGILFGDLGDKRIAESVHGPDDARAAGRISDAVSNLIDDARQAGVGDEHTGPHAIEQLILRKRTRPRLHEQLQQLERLRRQVDLLPFVKHSPCVEVEATIAETEHVVESEAGLKTRLYVGQ
jgi:hypothetical protein